MLLETSSTRNAQISHGMNHKELSQGHFSANEPEFPAGQHLQGVIWVSLRGPSWELEEKHRSRSVENKTFPVNTKANTPSRASL